MAETLGDAVPFARYSTQRTAALQLHRSAISYLVAGLDALIIVLAAIAAGLTYNYLAFGYIEQPTRYLAIGLVFAAGFVLLMMVNGYYKPSSLVFFFKQVAHIGVCSLALASFFGVVVFLLGASDVFSRGAIAIFAATSMSGVVASRAVWVRNISLATSRGLVEKKKVFLIRAGQLDGTDFEEKMTDIGMEPVHIFDLDPAGEVTSLLADVGRAVAKQHNEIFVATAGMRPDVVRAVLKELRELPVPVKLILDPFVAQLAVLPATSLGDTIVVELQRAPLNLVERSLKRCFDIMVAAAAILAFAPPMAMVAIAIKIDSPGPVLFRQKRRGFNNVTFDILKFRSMSVMESGDRMVQATRNDARVTRVGKFIRSTSVDELPQFWNVLFGQMSVVGPRPHAVSQEDQYDELIARYAFRRHVKPGITGWAQINGHRGETPTVSSMESRLEHDLWYMQHWSLWLDVKIVTRTFVAMFDRGSAF